MAIVKRLNHTRMRVDDLERTVNFYKDVLGLEETRRHESPRGSKLVFLKTPNSDHMIEITYYPDSGPVQCQPDLVHLAFEVENVDAFIKHAESKNVPITDGPTTSSSGTRFCFIDAPEGYEIELIELAG